MSLLTDFQNTHAYIDFDDFGEGRKIEEHNNGN